MKSSLKAQRQQRGQAMVEYSVINFVLVIGLVMFSQVRMLPGGTEQHMGKQNIIEAFLAAYQIYYDSFYFVLNMPFP